MARPVRDVALACSQLAGPDGEDAFSTITGRFDAGLGARPGRPLRVGWMVGPVDRQVAAIVKAAAEALRGLGVHVEPVGIPALEREVALDVFNRLHVMKMKPASHSRHDS